MTFWSLDELDLTDSLNAEMWTRSPTEQERIQPYKDDWTIGKAGAQQAMRYPHRLPWVPDVVGRDWKSPDAVLIFGSAYGAFIRREGRPGFIAPAEYARASSAAEFTRLFSAKVLPASYYSRSAQLVSTVVPSCRLVGLLDLCRVAFVRRLEEDDEQGEEVNVSSSTHKYLYTGSTLTACPMNSVRTELLLQSNDSRNGLALVRVVSQLTLYK